MAKAPVSTDYEQIRAQLYDLVDRAIESAQSAGYLQYEIKADTEMGSRPELLPFVEHHDTGHRTLILEWEESPRG